MQGKNLPGCIEEKNISLCFSAHFSVMITCCRLFWAYAMVPSKGFNFSNCKSFMSSFITSMPPKNHEWEYKKKNNLLRAAGKVLPSWRSGCPFLERPVKSCSFNMLQISEKANNCRVSKIETCPYWRCKGIYVTRKVSGPRFLSTHTHTHGTKH